MGICWDGGWDALGLNGCSMGWCGRIDKVGAFVGSGGARSIAGIGVEIGVGVGWRARGLRVRGLVLVVVIL